MTGDIVHGCAAYAGVRAVVLGATGFVGAWVARALTLSGADLACVVRDRARADRVLCERGVTSVVFERDLAEPGSVEDVLATFRPAIVFNLAGYGVDHGERDDAQTWRMNADLVDRICGAIAKTRDPAWPSADLVHVGSAGEYGDTGGVVDEEVDPRPSSVYGRAKLGGTQRLAAMCRELGVKGLTARLFTVYGPGEHAGRLLPSLIEASRTHARLALTSGTQLRDFTFVGDVVEGLLRLGVAPHVPAGEVVNLATGQVLSVRHFIHVAASILELPEQQLVLGALPTRSNELAHSGVSIARLRRLLDWSPALSVEEGIRMTLQAELRSDRGSISW